MKQHNTPEYESPLPLPEITKSLSAICIVHDDQNSILKAFEDMSQAKRFAEEYENSHNTKCTFNIIWLKHYL